MSNVCRDPWHDNNEPVDGPCPKCGEGNQAEARAQLDDHLTARDQHRLACGTCGKRLRDHIEGVTGHAFVRTFAPARAPLDVDRLARALHQLQSGPHRDRNPVAGEGRDACDLDAARLAREYAALEEPTPVGYVPASGDDGEDWR